MGKRKVTLEEEENLGNEVKKYPCLFDKTIISYKDSESISNAWKEIESVLGLPEGEYLFQRKYALSIHENASVKRITIVSSSEILFLFYLKTKILF